MRSTLETRRAGVSLVELIVALSLFTLLLTVTLSFYRRQGTAFTESNDRMAVMQNLRYGVNSLVQNIRTAGVGVPSTQPVLVYADVDVVAFNADYATNVENDFFAVYFDPRLPNGAVSALTPARSITIPNSTFVYPSASYHLGSGNSPAETLIYYFELDTETDRTDDYVLFRQVNNQAPDVVARRLLRSESEFFTYYVLDASSTGSPVVEVPSTDLPSAHTEPIHGSPDDTGPAAAVDSIRAIRVSYAATNGLVGSHEAVREITRLIRLPNAGLATQPNCGNPPMLGASLSANGVAATESVAGHIKLSWNAAVDEVTGEQDVLRYVLWRRVGGSGEWGDPLFSVSPGASSYVYRDFDAEPNVGYSYGVSAQDCTPQFSPISVSPTAMWSQE